MKQLAREERRYANLAVILRETCAPAADWSYQPPRSDNWLEWCPVARYCAAELRYRQAGETWALLRLGGGPFYCPACSERPGAGWRARLCLGCWWESDGGGYDQALKAARLLGRRWTEQTRELVRKAS